MTVKCPYCNSDIDETNSVIALTELKKYIETQLEWDVFESDRSYPVGREFNVGNFIAEVVAKKTDYDSGEIDRSDFYDSELPQGTTFDTWIVIKYKDSFFKKMGQGDSYGEVTWGGEFVPVVPKTKTIQVYEFGGTDA